MCKKHEWRVIETDKTGNPTKYKCLNCLLIHVKKKHLCEYFDVLNSICNRILENKQKISIIKLNPLNTINDKLLINNLQKEIEKLTKMHKFGV